ncbi:MAG: hypothetical protein IJE43_25360 [Alphaproteobacteria bacterium]|nr:hypothetical protein [Alphaproteobacteria bacterium]
MLAILPSIAGWGQEKINAVEELVEHGFENVRWTENEDEYIYTIENNVYKAEGVGISKAIDIIQKHGLPTNKRCKVIVTHLEVPELSLTYHPIRNDSTVMGNKTGWQTSYEIGQSWDSIKKEKAKNSSRFKVDILIYPQLSFKNLIITQIYQVLFTLNPAVEISLWPGMKLTGQLIVPIYNDGYGYLQDKVHPGFITLSQRFRLPFNIKGMATVGYFSADRYGADLQLFYPFKDERFSLEGRIGSVAIGYWNGFNLHYDTEFSTTWSLGANFYWPRYNTSFSLKGEKYLMGERGVKFEMIRHFRYASVGFYAQKAKEANSNGGFRIQVLLPPYKYKRFKNKYIPRLNTSYNMGIVYNAGNERYYYRQYRSVADENIMNSNRFNPYFIKSEISNNY